MRFRRGPRRTSVAEPAVTQSRICAAAHLRRGGSAPFKRKRAALGFVTG